MRPKHRMLHTWEIYFLAVCEKNPYSNWAHDHTLLKKLISYHREPKSNGCSPIYGNISPHFLFKENAGKLQRGR